MLAHDERCLRHADALRRHDLIGLARSSACRPDGCRSHARTHFCRRSPCCIAPGTTSPPRRASRRASASSSRCRCRRAIRPPRVRIAITTSSSAALPARSPMPLIVHSICRAPPATPANELATARPRSLWQWTEKIALSEFGTRARTVSNSASVFLRDRVADRVGNVDRGRAGLDRRLDAAAEKIDLGARAVLRRPFDVVDILRARASPRRSSRRAPPPASC